MAACHCWSQAAHALRGPLQLLILPGTCKYGVSTPAKCPACREDPPGSRAAGKKRKLVDTEEEEAAWSTVCLTLEDLQEFAQKLGASRQAGCQLHLQKTPLTLMQLSANDALGIPQIAPEAD